MICGIGLPWTDTCAHLAGHLGRCSWDTRRTVDPVYEEHATPNLLDPNEVAVNEQAPYSVFMSARKHGTHSGYVAGCRCLLCTDAAAEYMRQYRAALRDLTPAREKPLALGGLSAPEGHGTNARYTHGKCHCSWCSAAHAEYMREYRARSVDSRRD